MQKMQLHVHWRSIHTDYQTRIIAKRAAKGAPAEETAKAVAEENE